MKLYFQGAAKSRVFGKRVYASIHLKFLLSHAVLDFHQYKAKFSSG